MYISRLLLLGSFFFITIMISSQTITAGHFINDCLHDSIKNSQPLRNTSEAVEEIQAKEENLAIYGALHFGLGHHDNLTNASTVGEPKLKTAGFSWTINLDSGMRFKNAYVILFLSGVAPIPMTKSVGGYKHKDGLYDYGLSLRFRPLSRRAKIGLTAIGGYKLFRERALIYDPKGTMPDLLVMNDNNNGPFYGAEITYRIKKWVGDEERLLFTYIHENLNNNANIYRLEWGGLFDVDLMKKKPGTKESKMKFGYLSFGLELITRSGERMDWFITVSFAVETKSLAK